MSCTGTFIESVGIHVGVCAGDLYINMINFIVSVCNSLSNVGH